MLFQCEIKHCEKFIMHVLHEFKYSNIILTFIYNINLMGCQNFFMNENFKFEHLK